MVKRCCPKCNAVFKQKCHFDYHINRKFDCSLNGIHPNDLNNENNDNLNICQNLPKFAKIYQKFFKSK